MSTESTRKACDEASECAGCLENDALRVAMSAELFDIKVAYGKLFNENAALCGALSDASDALELVWAAIGDALCSGSGIEQGYANAVAAQCRAASNQIGRALAARSPATPGESR